MPHGEAFLRSFGLDLDTLKIGTRRRGGRMFCRPCLDWSERHSHVVGAALYVRCLDLSWVRRMQGTRALSATPEGWRELREAFTIIDEARLWGESSNRFRRVAARITRTGLWADEQGLLHLSLPVAQTVGRPRLPATPICASVSLLSQVSPISARVGRHEDNPFACQPDRLR